MKFTKKFLAALLALLMLVSLAACGETEPAGTGDETDPAAMGEVLPEGSEPAESESEDAAPVESEPEETEPEEERKLTVEEQAYQNGLLFEGSDALCAAIADVFARAEAGEEITVVCLGDSITYGAGADAPASCWVQLLNRWFKNTFKASKKINMVNAGIGSTEATLGAARTQAHVLAYEPDLVIVDFGTNDFGMPYAQETYEGIISQLMAQNVPVINFNACPRNGNNCQDKDYEVNVQYGIPQLDFRSSYYMLSISEDPGNYAPDRLWTADNVHPSTLGHHQIADMITTYLGDLLSDYQAGKITPAALSGEPIEPLTANNYGDAILFTSDSEPSELASFATDAFTSDYNATTGFEKMHGWRCAEEGGTITFTTTAGYCTIFYRNYSKASKLDITIDGVHTNTINGYGTGDWNLCYTNILHEEPGTEHTITCTVLPDETNGTCWFGITALALSNFN